MKRTTCFLFSALLGVILLSGLSQTALAQERGNEKEWTIIINDKLSWGTQYDENEDVLRVTVTPEEAMMREQFIINFKNVTGSSAEAVLHWDTVAVPFTIEVNE